MNDQQKHPLKSFVVFGDLLSRTTVVAACFCITEQGVNFRDESNNLTAHFPPDTCVVSADASRVLAAPAASVELLKSVVTDLAPGEAFAVDLPPTVTIGTISITGATPECAASIAAQIQGLMDHRQSVERG